MKQKKLLERKFNPSADTYNVQRHGQTTQIGSQVNSRSGPNKQKSLCDTTAVHCGKTESSYAQARFFARKKEDEKF